MNPYPVLYSFRRCPYAMRARMALHDVGIQCEIREVSLKHNPQALLDISPKATVPVLQLPDGDILDESFDIMRQALTRCDPDGWWPEPQPLQEQIVALVEQNDGVFKYHLDRYKYPDRFNSDPDAHFAEAQLLLADLNQRLQVHRWLTGESVSLADVALFPFVRQFAATDRDRFYRAGFVSLTRWLDHWLADERFTAIMQKRSPWQTGEPPVFLISL